MQRRFSYLVFIAAMLAFAQASDAGEQFPKILVTVAPLKPYMEELTRGAGNIQNLMRPGQDPHHFALAPSQAQMLATAEIVVVPDLSMNPLLKQLLAKNPSIRVIELSKLEGAQPLPYAQENPWIMAVKAAGHEDEEDAHDDHRFASNTDRYVSGEKRAAPTPVEPPNMDPHLWLDPERMAALALPLADAISTSAAPHRETLRANATTLATHLRRDVIPAMQTLLTPRERQVGEAKKPTVAFITYHAAYQYFLARFGISNSGELVVRPEDYIGAKSLDSLLNAAKRTHIRCIIGESNTSLVKRIASLSQARVVILSPEQNVESKDASPLPWITNDYDRFLYKTAKSFGDCL